MLKTCFVTGGAGFIGSNFIRHWLHKEDDVIVNIDKLTYAGNPDTVQMLNENARHIFIKADIVHTKTLRRQFASHRPRFVVHFAAESHVDRSIENPEVFIQTNIEGTYRLLEAVKEYYQTLPPDEQAMFRFLHVSTDEVFGTLGESGEFYETHPYAPSTPYSATKGASNLLAHAWQKTYRLPILTVNCSNNYGPFQAPEKLVPKTILNAIRGDRITIHGQGAHIRDWLYVEDCCDGLRMVLHRGKPGENYSIGGNNEKTTLEVVELICRILEQTRTLTKSEPLNELIWHIPDRPANDFRYSLNTEKIETQLGWKPRIRFDDGIERTVQWYLEHQDWLYHAADRLKMYS